MSNPLDLYKEFIDALVERRPCVTSAWVLGDGYPDLPSNAAKNQALRSMTPEQRQVVAEIAQHARDGGIHDTLAYLNDQILLAGLRLSRDGVEFAIEPFDTMHYDWVCRREGDAWPDEADSGQAKPPDQP